MTYLIQSGYSEDVQLTTSTLGYPTQKGDPEEKK